MAAAMIGVDPHKASHTAVAISAAEEPLGDLRVRACVAQAERLLAAGERVLDVPPKLGARVRLLDAGDVNKNDPNDARSVAVAAPRSAGVREVRADDHAAVLKVRAERYRDLGRTRTRPGAGCMRCCAGWAPAVSRRRSRQRAPVSCGPRKVHRLSRRGNRRLNHAIHMAAVTQIGHRHSQGRAYSDKKLAGG
ncbi:MAG TPA: transposase, partial [Streptosporangiaceae bacterium]|nr:transposase [Streptosporangiaceae bacterium]